MKLLFLILTLAFSQMISAQPGSYSHVPLSEYNNARIQRALRYGINEVVQQGIKVGRLPSSPPFRVTKIDSIERQVVNGLNYRFVVELSNGQMTVKATYVVHSEAGTGKLTLTSSSFDITSASNNRLLNLILPPPGETGVPGGWTPQDVSILNTDSIFRDILNFGVQGVLSKEGLSDANYYIEDVLSIETQVVSGANYNFSVILGDHAGNEVALNFTVYDQQWTGKRELKGYEFIANPGGEELLPGGWESIELDQHVKYILDFGVKIVTDDGIENNQLPNSTYQPIEIYRVKEQNGENYRFNLRLENDEGGYVTAIIIVHFKYYPPEIIIEYVSSYLFLDIQDSGYEETNEETNEDQ